MLKPNLLPIILIIFTLTLSFRFTTLNALFIRLSCILLICTKPSERG